MACSALFAAAASALNGLALQDPFELIEFLKATDVILLAVPGETAWQLVHCSGH